MPSETYGNSVTDTQVSSEVAINRIEMLCNSNSTMMKDFSRQSVNRLNQHLAFRLFISLVQQFIDANVHKEIKKDCLIIQHATFGFDSSRDRKEISVEDLFKLTKQIDHEFMKKLPPHLFSCDVRHDDFAEIRKQRIEMLVNKVFSLLSNWSDETPYEIIVRRTYSEDTYRKLLREFFQLYNLETKALTNAVSFHGPAHRIKDLFAVKLFASLETTAGDIVAEYTRRIYHNRISPDKPSDHT